MTRQLPLVIYHANCADGFTAAWAVHKAMPADFHAAFYQAPPPDVTGRDVIMVDFCYHADVMQQLRRAARSLLVLDHHKTANEVLPHCTSTALDALTCARLDQRGWTAPKTWEYVQGCAELDRLEGITQAVIYALIDQQRSGAGIAWTSCSPHTRG